jgi:hypothetical protein
MVKKRNNVVFPLIAYEMGFKKMSPRNELALEDNSFESLIYAKACCKPGIWRCTK